MGVGVLMAIVVIVLVFNWSSVGLGGEDQPATYATQTIPPWMKNNQKPNDLLDHQASPGTPAPAPTLSAGTEGSNSQAAAVDCSTAKDCIECLYRKPSSEDSNCVWCASTAKCQAASASCNDIEDRSCPAVLHTKPPQTIRVIHVAIRKGGPEALVQMHLALNHWGFKTTLDTRKSKKQKGGEVVPFFRQVYKDEFATAPQLRWVKDYDDWLASGSEGDVLLATETWKCPSDGKEKLAKGIRYMQWHLTVWPQRDRSSCTIAVHTNYIADQYMKQPLRSLMFPYISPHIVALAATKPSGGWKKDKVDLVMYDSDTKLKDEQLKSRNGIKHETKIATGYTPEKLYELYGKMKAGIDLRLPGGERFIYEAALFDVCVVVDKSLNGLDTRDFPIPERFRVKPDDLDDLNRAKDECVSRYDSVIDEFAPFKQFVLSQRTTFYRQVRRYYSSSVHVVASVCQQEQVGKIPSFIAGILVQFPFATIEIHVNSGLDAKTSIEQPMKTLYDHSYLAAVTIVEDSHANGCSSSSSGSEFLFKPPGTNGKRSLYTLFLKDVATFVFPAADTVHAFGSVVEHHRRQHGNGKVAALGVSKGADLRAGFMLTETAVSKCSKSAGSLADCGGEVVDFATSDAVAANSLLSVDQYAPLELKEISSESKAFLCSHIIFKTVSGGYCS